jgi:hypothetical protein
VRSAAKLESVGVVMTVITVMTTVKAAGKFRQGKRVDSDGFFCFQSITAFQR